MEEEAEEKVYIKLRGHPTPVDAWKRPENANLKQDLKPIEKRI